MPCGFVADSVDVLTIRPDRVSGSCIFSFLCFRSSWRGEYFCFAKGVSPHSVWARMDNYVYKRRRIEEVQDEEFIKNDLPEYKHVDALVTTTSLDNSLSGTGGRFYFATGVGSDDNQYVGKGFRMWRLHIRFCLIWQNFLSVVTDRFVNNLVRCVVVLSRKASNIDSGFPTLNNVVRYEVSASEASTFGAFADVEKGLEFDILLDKIICNNNNVRLTGADRNDYVSTHEYILDLGGIKCIPYGPEATTSGYNKIFIFLKKAYETSAGISCQGVVLDGGSSCARLFFSDM